MAKSMHLGKSNSTLGKAKKGYIGDTNSIPRKIKKMFIGDANSKPRLFFSSGGELGYKGISELLTSRKGGTYGVANSHYALFKNQDQSTNVLALTPEFTIVAAPATEDYAGWTAQAATSSYLFVCGGRFTSPSKDDKEYDTINAYDTSLTKNSSLSLASKIYNSVGGTINNKALIAGGKRSKYVTDLIVVTNELSRSGATSLSVGRSELSCANVGNYIIFAGGTNGSSSSVDAVDAYNTSLTKVSTISRISNYAHGMVGCNNSNYAIFAGGIEHTKPTDVVTAYDKNLTMTVATRLSTVRANHAGASTDDLAVISGGSIKRSSYISDLLNSVESFDTSLTKKIEAAMPTNRVSHASVFFNDHVLMAGGFTGGYTTDSDDNREALEDKRIVFYTI